MLIETAAEADKRRLDWLGSRHGDADNAVYGIDMIHTTNEFDGESLRQVIDAKMGIKSKVVEK